MSSSLFEDIKDKSLEAQYWLNDYKQKAYDTSVQIDVALRQLDQIDKLISRRHSYDEDNYTYTYSPINDKIDEVVEKVKNLRSHDMSLRTDEVISLLNGLKE